MYRYDSYDQALVDARVDEFRDQVGRRLSGALSEDQFKPLRLKNGLYLQLHAYMLRVAIPYGTLSSAQLRMLAHVARRYDRGYGHFTTRQNIQYNWIKLAEAPDLLAELATVEMHAIQTSGNCIRNISSDQYAGAAADEVADPRPYAELLRQWSTFHPEFSYLPRKFKIAVTGAATDRAAIRLHDIGLQLVAGPDGAVGLKVFVGGGMGRTPMVAPLLREYLDADRLCSYCEAILRVYNRHGRRDNMYKARIKILVDALGIDAFREQVEAEWTAMAGSVIDPPPAELARIAAQFAPPALYATMPSRRDMPPAVRKWIMRNTAPNKIIGHSIVTISLKPVGGIPGDASAEQMDIIADLADRYSFGEIRVTHSQNLVLAHVANSHLPALHAALDAAGLATPNLDMATDIIACPGLDYCALANARSIPVAEKIAVRLASTEDALGELKIKISGCINACGHHHAGHIGILGVDRKGAEQYQLLLGGSGAEDASLAKIIGPGFSEDGVVDAVERVTQHYLSVRNDGERFLDTYRRLGAEPFKQAAYAA